MRIPESCLDRELVMRFAAESDELLGEYRREVEGVVARAVNARSKAEPAG